MGMRHSIIQPQFRWTARGIGVEGGVMALIGPRIYVALVWLYLEILRLLSYMRN